MLISDVSLDDFISIVNVSTRKASQSDFENLKNGWLFTSQQHTVLFVFGIIDVHVFVDTHACVYNSCLPTDLLDAVLSVNISLVIN